MRRANTVAAVGAPATSLHIYRLSLVIRRRFMISATHQCTSVYFIEEVQVSCLINMK